MSCHPLLDARVGRPRRTLDSIVAAGFIASPEVLIQVGQSDRGAFPLTCSTTLLAGLVLPTGQRHLPAMNTLLHRATSDRILYVGAGASSFPDWLRLHRWKPKAWRRTSPTRWGAVAGRRTGCPDHYPARWDASLRWRNTTHHQGMACPRTHLLEAGGFREDLAVLGDYAMNLTLWQAGVQAAWTDGEDWVSVQSGGVSRQFTPSLYAEERRMKREVLQPGPVRWIQPLWIALKSRWKRGRQFGR